MEKQEEKKNQSDYKPGSVPPVKAVPAIYPHVPLPTRSIVLPSGVPLRKGNGIGRATLCRRYTRTFSSRCAQPVCHHTAGGLLPHLLTLTSFLQ